MQNYKILTKFTNHNYTIIGYVYIKYLLFL